eukprot:TRINITY_DN78074_c0_g1_i1.p1 TRINITY_DN78074_c0_g1~~TRINITY_DN78074_c0_g1_i1.p1  ORF type:complete len:449 (+),score=73.92 TRINITY_DN78074_c0_g1_i1:55-1401(+)
MLLHLPLPCKKNQHASPAAVSSPGKKILSGIKVVEIATVIAGPTCCAFLADMGAEVIKIERPGEPDVARTWGLKDDPGKTASPELFNSELGGGSSFTQFNRGKRSLVLDIQKPEGKAILKKMLATTDLFVTNVRAKSLKKLGLYYDDLKDEFPRLIYGHLNAWGVQGPMTEAPGFDVGAWWAYSGIMELARPSDDSPMPRQVGGIGDSVLAVQFAGFLGTALYHRERTGQGQLVDAALMRSGLAAIAHPVCAAAGGNKFITGPIQEAGGMGYIREPTVLGQRRTSISYVPFRCKCGQWIHMMDLVPDRLNPKIFKAFGITELDVFGPPETHTKTGEHMKKGTAVIDKIMGTKTWAEWKPIFEKNDIWHAVINKFENMLDDEQAQANGALVHHPDIRHPLIGLPVLLSAHTAEPAGRAPIFGEHTSDVLRDHGFTAAEEAELRKKKVIA